MFFRRMQLQTWLLLRRRLIRETEAALLFGINHPRQVPRIPTVEVGSARFHPQFAREWWEQVLSLEGESGLPALKDADE